MSAISKADVLERFTEKDEALYRAWEEKINYACENGLDYAGRVIIGVINTSLPKRVLDRIVKEYTAAGWCVTYHSDQRDGDFIQLA